jgi:hypothetical protein
MPNGRTGGFAVTRRELERPLEKLSSDAPIGMRFHPRPSPVTVSELIQMLETHPVDSIGIEEQNHGSFYIIHLDINFEKKQTRLERFVGVSDNSPLYGHLRQLRLQSLKKEE